MDGHQRDDISAAGSHGDHGYDGVGGINDAHTRGFLPTSSPWWQGGSSGLFPGAAQPAVASRSFTDSRLAFDSLDLNDGDGWQQMDHYAGFLRGDNDGPPMPSPPVRVPSPNVARSRGLNAGSAGGSGEGAARGAEAFVSPVPRPRGRASGGSGRRRGRSARERWQGPAIVDDNLQQDDYTAPRRVMVQMTLLSMFIFLYNL
jgi:hypothetical protein